MKKLIVLNALVLLAAIAFNSSYATVLVEDSRFNTESGDPRFTEGTIATGDGSSGGYSLIGCATEVLEEPNSFNAPTPGSWTELDNNTCGGGGDCILGIWGKFLDTPESEDITCRWNDPQYVFAAGSFRYSQVDKQNPIIEAACNSGIGNTATAPSITTEALSQVARIYSGSRLPFLPFAINAEPIATNNIVPLPQDTFFGTTSINGFSIFIQGDTALTVNAGETGEATLDLSMIGAPTDPIDFAPAAWRACTVGLRMQSRAVPTLSEWGFLAVAGFMGAAGVWYLRRRQQAV